MDDFSANSGLETAVTMLQAGHGSDAESRALRVAEAEPSSARAWQIVGIARHQQGRPEAALAAFERALTLDAQLDEAREACATLLFGLKRPKAALAMTEELVCRYPGTAKFMTNAGVLHEALGEPEAALANYDDALRYSKTDFRARLNRGVLLARLGRLEDALRDSQALVRAYAGSAAAYYNMADVLLRLDRYADALVAVEKARKLQPEAANILMLRGLVLAMLDRDSEAAASFSRAREHDAEVARRYRLAAASAAGLVDEDRLTFDPRQIRLARLLERQKICDWSERGRLVEGMRAMTAVLKLSPAPLEEMGLYLTALSLPLKAEELQVLAHGLALAAQTRADSDSPLRVSRHEKAGMQTTGKKIRLGFLSPNFREHPSAQLHWRHFALRDRNRFEVFAFSLHRSEGRLRECIIESCDVFREVSELSSREIAARIAIDEIDILVDLAGHKDFSRPEVLALRPAPLQVSYLGLPGTIGSELVDYRLTDGHATPPETDGGWSEKLVRLPNTVWIYNDLEEIAEMTPTRDVCGLPELGFVFCCFNANYKIEPDAFSAWMRLLIRVPGSVLWLLDGGKEAQRNLRREAVARGVAPDRLIFAPRIPRADHLARHACADLFLDTFYYGAHTTAADALWAGLPVLTCHGSTMASCIGASIVLATGLPELVAPDHAAYEAMALRLATHPQELAALRGKLAHNRTQCAMFDTAQRVRELDRAFEIMWQRHLAGLPPENFAVPSELGTRV